MIRFILVMKVLCTTEISFVQMSSATCNGKVNNTAATRNIFFVKKYSPKLTPYNYKSNIILTNNTN